MASSQSVSTDWQRSAGDFECAGACKRKRLPASEFSGAQAQKAIKSFASGGNKSAKCKRCAEQLVEQERAAAQAQPRVDETNGEGEFPCAHCGETRAAAMFSKNQLNKVQHSKPGKCLSCVKSIEDKESKEASERAETRRKELEKAAENGDVKSILELANFEAATVTGIKSTRGGRGRGRGRGVGRGRGR